MKENKERKPNSLKYAGVLFITILAVGLALSAYFVTIVNQPAVEPEEIIVPAKPQRVYLTFGDPGEGKSGCIRAGLYPHQADPATAYASNLTVGNFYEYTETNNTAAGSNVPWGTAYDVVYLVCWNQTHAYESTNSTWMLSYVNATVYSPDLSLNWDALLEYNISGVVGNDRIYVHYVANNAGSGFTLAKGGQVQQCLADFWATF